MLVDCPTCGGTGKIEQYKCNPEGDCIPYQETCPNCEGEGQVFRRKDEN